MDFADSAKNEAMSYQDKKLTENGAVAYRTSGNGALLNLFATCGALRSRTEQGIERKFAEAFAEDKLLATKMLFYCGNVRGGLGERRTFRICLHWLAQNYPTIVNKNLSLIPLFNRWDSIFVLVDTPCEQKMWEYVEATFKEDLKDMSANKSISLMAKWMPSENASSINTKKLAKNAMRHLGLTPREYRKILSRMRAYLNIVERKMSAKDWDEITYAAVPSYAMKNYSAAFKKHDYERFQAYLDSVKKGKTKINASTLYPYDLVHKVLNSPNDETTELQWKALPNYVHGENNFIVMADVSGSMYGRPLETSIGLAMYFAEHNNGKYHNLYMTFTENPHFVCMRDGDSLYTKVSQAIITDIGYSTNLMGAFDYILDHAIRNRIPANEMPKALVVISDMEIDPFFLPGSNFGFVETARLKFARAGYQLPNLVMWNVEARHDTFLTKDENVLLVSGQSASVFKQLCAILNGKTAYDLMLETLNDKMYDCVVI